MTAMTLQVGLLGPFQVSTDGEPVDVPPGRLQALMATLALSAGQPVSVDRLATAVWGEDFSVDARVNLQSNVRRLRRLLGAEMITTSGKGYVLEVEPDDVDALRFLRLLDDAVAAVDPEAKRDRLAGALKLRRGAPFEGVQSDWLEHTQSASLEERYLAALEQRIDLDLNATGATFQTTVSVSDLAAELGEITARFPLRESLWVRLLIALHLSGRSAQALEQYEAIRVRLVEELGADPGPELQRAHADLLAGRTPQVPSAAAQLRAVPHQLPAGTDMFIGRREALRTLDDLLDREGDPEGQATLIAAITGTAGVGKTALAVHWAHRAADRFPDGQLYVNLRGFDPTGSPMEPSDVLRGFLNTMQVPPQQIPTGLDAQAGLFRSLLADRRLLVVLDNAHGAEQVTPLLPGAPGCMAIVTSRNQLPALVARGARLVVLDLLDREEAVQLFTRRIGRERVAAENEATYEVVARCAGLPLALAIVAARAVSRPNFPLATQVESLRNAADKLDGLETGDASTSARAVFSWSYRGLDEPAARLFRLLGLHPGPDVAVTAVASLADLATEQVRLLLAELAHAHLLVEHVPGRYAFHDLLRAYAVELGRSADPEPDRSAATRRLFDYYVHSANAADHLLYPHDDKPSLEPPQAGVTVEDLVDQEQALAWFVAEHEVLLAAVREANRAGLHRHACHLAWAMSLFLHRRGRWHDRADYLHAALGAARRLADPAAQARGHLLLAGAEADLDRFADAYSHYRHAFVLAEDMGDVTMQAEIHYGRNLTYGQEGRPDHALAAAQEAWRLFEQSGDQIGQANALTDIGWWHARLGDVQQALPMLQDALALHHQLDNLAYQAHTWSCLGETHNQNGDFTEAIACYGRSLELFEVIGDRYGEASALAHLSSLLRAVSDSGADHASERARDMADSLDPPAAEQLRRELLWLGPRPT